MFRLLLAAFLVVVQLPARADDIIRLKPRVDHLTDADSGYVLASEARFEHLYFVNVKSRQQYWSDGTYCGRLPVGHYELYKINSPYGTVTSDAPFSFDVVAGQRHYLGTVAPPWVSDAKKYADEMAKNPTVRKYDLSKFMKIAYNYAVIDQLSVLSEKYQKRCKDVNVSDFTVSLMQ
jgi:hypothetical protein